MGNGRKSLKPGKEVASGLSLGYGCDVRVSQRQASVHCSKAVAYRKQYKRSTFSIITRYEILRGLKAKRDIKQLTRFEALCRTSQSFPSTIPSSSSRLTYGLD